MVLTAPNNWCINNHLTKGKIYPLVTEYINGGFWNGTIRIMNDTGEVIDAPFHCFETLKNNRKRKLEILNKCG